MAGLVEGILQLVLPAIEGCIDFTQVRMIASGAPLLLSSSNMNCRQYTGNSCVISVCMYMGWTDDSMILLQKLETAEHTHGAPAGHCKGNWVKIFERLPGGR